MPGGWLSPDEGRRLGRSLRAFERESRNSLPPLEKKIRSVSESSSYLYLLIMGAPTGGKIVLTVDVTIGDDPPVSEDVTIFLPAYLQEINDAFAAHSAIDAGQVIAHAAAIADDSTTDVFPGREIFLSTANGLGLGQIEITAVDETFMTGGAHIPYLIMRT